MGSVAGASVVVVSTTGAVVITSVVVVSAAEGSVVVSSVVVVSAVVLSVAVISVVVSETGSESFIFIYLLKKAYCLLSPLLL